MHNINSKVNNNTEWANYTSNPLATDNHSSSVSGHLTYLEDKTIHITLQVSATITEMVDLGF